MKCINCNKEFEAKRETAKFCSSKCRLAFHRSKDSVSMNAKVSVSQVSVSQTDEERIGKVIKGYCHGCGRDIKTIKEQWVNPEKATQEDADRICICLPCIKKGITHEKLGLKC